MFDWFPKLFQRNKNDVLSPSGLYSHARKSGDNSFEIVTEIPVEIGRPKVPPSAEILDRLRDAVMNSGATKIYWFWLSVNGDQPHLGLAVAPNDNEIVKRIGQAVEPIWAAYSPDNSTFDILRLGSSNDKAIFKMGKILFDV